MKRVIPPLLLAAMMTLPARAEDGTPQIRVVGHDTPVALVSDGVRVWTGDREGLIIRWDALSGVPVNWRRHRCLDSLAIEAAGEALIVQCRDASFYVDSTTLELFGSGLEGVIAADVDAPDSDELPQQMRDGIQAPAPWPLASLAVREPALRLIDAALTDSELLVLAEQSWVRVTRDLQPVWVRPVHDTSADTLDEAIRLDAILSDGARSVVVGCSDGRRSVWSPDDGNPLHTLDSPCTERPLFGRREAVVRTSTGMVSIEADGSLSALEAPEGTAAMTPPLGRVESSLALIETWTPACGSHVYDLWLLQHGQRVRRLSEGSCSTSRRLVARIDSAGRVTGVVDVHGAVSTSYSISGAAIPDGNATPQAAARVSDHPLNAPGADAVLLSSTLGAVIWQAGRELLVQREDAAFALAVLSDGVIIAGEADAFATPRLAPRARTLNAAGDWQIPSDDPSIGRRMFEQLIGATQRAM